MGYPQHRTGIVLVKVTKKLLKIGVVWYNVGVATERFAIFQEPQAPIAPCLPHCFIHKVQITFAMRSFKMQESTEVHILEYNKQQDAYHINTVSGRAKCTNNHEWPEIDRGTYLAMQDLLDKRTGFVK